MTHLHLVRAVFQPWLITPEAHGAVALQIAAKAGMIAPMALREGVGPCGEEVELEQMQIEDGVAYIPIGGVMARKLGAMEKGAGAVDYLDIAEDIAIAEEDESVLAIVLDMDTPGGTVNGCPELSDVIANCTKPVVAYSAGMIASAGYWLAAACDKIAISRSAEAGSIGVYCAHMDITEYYANLGVKVSLFASGANKGAGFPGVPLTDEQRNTIRADITRMALEFKNHVTTNRPDVPESAMDGRMFGAMEALEIGLIDDVCGSREEAGEMALELAIS
jgi:signal peptide peptidase SppA